MVSSWPLCVPCSTTASSLLGEIASRLASLRFSGWVSREFPTVENSWTGFPFHAAPYTID